MMAFFHHGPLLLHCKQRDVEVLRDAEAPVLVSGMSRSGKLVATVDETKELQIYELVDGKLTKIIASTRMDKRATAISFDNEENAVVCSDKTGDFHRFHFADPKAKLERIGGHVSMVLDVAIGEDGKSVITCDRDHKVRVSRYPAAYVIDAFCLGHEDFVGAVVALPDGHALSGSGDGTLRLWDATTGSEIDNINAEVSRKLCVHHPTGVIASLFSKSVGIYRVDGQKIRSFSTLSVETEIQDISFDDLGNVWLLTQSKETPIMLFVSKGENRFEHVDTGLLCEPLKDYNLDSARAAVEYNSIHLNRKGDDEQEYFQRKKMREASKVKNSS